MKSQELIHCLSKEEKKMLLSVLKSKGSKESVVLFNEISKKSNDYKFDKKHLFSLVSEKEYTSKLDFKLRHFLRVLNEDICQFISGYVYEKKSKDNFSKAFNPIILLLEFFIEKKAFNLFKKEWKKYYKIAQEKKYFLLEKELVRLRFEFLTLTQEEKIEHYDELHSLIKKGIDCQQSYYLEEIRKMEYQLGFMHYRTLFSDDKSEIPKYEDLSLVKDRILKDNYFKYHQLLAQTFHERDHEKRIVLFEALIKLHPEVIKIRPELAKNERDYNNWLGHCYYFKKEFEKSAGYFERSMELMEENPKWLKLEIVYNYTSIMTKLERFDKPTEIYAKYAKQIQKNERVRYRIGYLIAISLIFKGRHSEAWDLLPDDIHNRPQNDYYYTRFIRSMIYFEEGDFELFEREVTNIYQSAHYKTPNELLWLDVSKIFKRMTKILLLPKSNRKEEGVKILDEIEEMDENYLMFKDVLPVKWIIKILESL